MVKPMPFKGLRFRGEKTTELTPLLELEGEHDCFEEGSLRCSLESIHTPKTLQFIKNLEELHSLGVDIKLYVIGIDLNLLEIMTTGLRAVVEGALKVSEKCQHQALAHSAKLHSSEVTK